jgi:hypothetical protein
MLPCLDELFGALRDAEFELAGVRFPKMTREQVAAGQGDWHFVPNMINLIEPGSVLSYRALPNGNDPNTCIFDIWSLDFFPEGKEPNVEVEFFEDWRDGDVGQVLSQNFRNLAGVTKGLHSRGVKGHWLNLEQEMSVRNAHVVADRYLFGTE